MKLILNADDFGLTEGVNLGIIKAFKEGIVRSTTMMVTMPSVDHAIELYKDNPTLGVGIHLTLTAGAPLEKNVYSLIDESGMFHKNIKIYKDEVMINKDELYREWNSQIQKFIELVGEKPTHIDSHHHVHLTPQCKEVAIKLAEEYGLPMRSSEHDIKAFKFVKLIHDFYDKNCNEEYFTKGKFNLLESEIFEIMCHPAIVDDKLLSFSSYAREREQELKVLIGEKVKKWVEDNNVQIINYTQI